MDFDDILGEIVGGAVERVGVKGAPILWRCLSPVGSRMWSAFAASAGRSGYWRRFSEDLRRHKPFWITAASMTAATWGFGVWYSVTGSTNGDTTAGALVLTTYAGIAFLIVHSLWRLSPWVKRRVH